MPFYGPTGHPPVTGLMNFVRPVTRIPLPGLSMAHCCDRSITLEGASDPGVRTGIGSHQHESTQARLLSSIIGSGKTPLPAPLFRRGSFDGRFRQYPFGKIHPVAAFRQIASGSLIWRTIPAAHIQQDLFVYTHPAGPIWQHPSR